MPSLHLSPLRAAFVYIQGRPYTVFATSSVDQAFLLATPGPRGEDGSHVTSANLSADLAVLASMTSRWRTEPWRGEA